MIRKKSSVQIAFTSIPMSEQFTAIKEHLIDIVGPYQSTADKSPGIERRQEYM